MPSDYKTLKKKVDFVFKEWVRLRDIEDNGFGKCISCWRTVKIGLDWHAGHFIPCTTIGTCFDERNVNGQCVYCNVNLRGNRIGYEYGIIEKYGKGVIEELENKAKEVKYLGTAMLLLLLDDYKEKLKELKKVKKIAR